MNPNTIESTAARTPGSAQQHSPRPARRSNGVRALAGAASLALAIGFSLAAAPPAVAAPVPVSLPGDIVSAFGTGGEITLQNNIIVNQSLTLAAGTELTIDLAGHTLVVNGTNGPAGTPGTSAGGNGLIGITNAGTLMIANGTFYLYGGDGGNGIDGEGGNAGNVGADATPDATPMPGGDGGDGGAGDGGGNGGEGGAGLVNTGVLLLSVTTTPEIQGGNGGNGGNGGAGGGAGEGGTGASGGDGGDGGTGGDGGAAGNGGDGGDGFTNTGIVMASDGRILGGVAGSGGDGGGAGPEGAGGAGDAPGTDGASGAPGLPGPDGSGGTDGNPWPITTDEVILEGNHTSVTPSTFFVAAPTGTTLGDIEPSLTTLAWPSVAGQTLTGWFTAATGGTQADAATLLSAQPTLYAQWAATASAPDPTLPATGASVGLWPWIAGLSMLIGLGLIAVTRPALARR